MEVLKVNPAVRPYQDMWLIVGLGCTEKNRLGLEWLVHRLKELGARVEACGLIHPEHNSLELVGKLLVTLPGQDVSHWARVLIRSITSCPLGTADTAVVGRALPNVAQYM